MISVLTPSYNKHEYVLDAIKSVINQSYQKWEYLIVDNSTDDKTRNVIKDFLKEHPDDRIKYYELNFSPEERKKFYVPAHIINLYYPKMSGDFVFYLSDDDIILPNCFSVCRKHFGSYSDHDFVYFSHETHNLAKQSGKTSEIKADRERGFGTGLGMDCAVDGGQVMHKRSCLDQISFPYYIESGSEISHCDGMFLQKLANKFKCHPINQVLGIHRVTSKSTWVST